MNRRTKEEVVEAFRCASIQDAAMRVIARKGVDEATIQDIADEAGIAKGTVYLYFRDRDELLAKTADRAFEKLVSELEPAFNASGSFADRLTGVIARQLQFFDENRALFRSTMLLSQRDGGAQKARSSCYARYSSLLETMFAEAQARGEMRAADPQAVAAVYRDCVRGVIVRRAEQKAQKRTSPAEDASFIASILLAGLQEK